MNQDLNQIAVLIPAYKPESRLTELCQDLQAQGFGEIVVVNDGSGDLYTDIFESVQASGCTLLTHAINMGKGRALKTGFNHLLTHRPSLRGVVTADADGQHLVKDIVRIGQALLESEDTIVLGSRMLNGKVPLKSRLGNTITKAVFNFITGHRVHDTQTGLRGLPISSLKPILALHGDRYEYEMNMLLEASKYKLALKEIEIETVYIDGNSGSHFNPWKDSWRIYRQIILFGGSSLFAAIVDFLLFTLITLILPGVLWAAVVGARIFSSIVNFSINRNVLFGSDQGAALKKHLIGYYTLAAFILVANYLLISAFSGIGINLYLSKIITEVLLFAVSFFIQKRVIFK